MWLGSTIGLHRIRGQTIAMRDQADGLSSNIVYSIFGGPAPCGLAPGRRRGRQPVRGRALQGLQGGPGPALGTSSPPCTRTARGSVGGNERGAGLSEGQSLPPVHRPGRGSLEGAVWAMHEDHTGVRWFATDAGLVALDGGQARRYTTAQGLPHDRVTALARGARGRCRIRHHARPCSTRQRCAHHLHGARRLHRQLGPGALRGPG